MPSDTLTRTTLESRDRSIVMALIETKPDVLRFDAIQAGQSTELRLTLAADRAFRITGVRHSRSEIVVDPIPELEQKSHVVTARLTPREVGDFTDALEIATTHSGQSLVVVPIFARVEPRAGIKITILSDFGEIRRVQDEIEDALNSAAYADGDIFYIKVAVEEALVNAVKHGNQLEPEKEVSIVYSVTPDRFEIRITDQGPGFDPEEVPDPTEVGNVERPCGRGLHIIRKFMTSVEYLERGNVVAMTKVIRNGRPD